MPHALLLSPDDQAVSAITGVLEEMSVTCERPLDGVSAAQKLNSQSFDLVLVDCENLPAAKLIFDVCRRGTGGNNPVPIAIVDGRAGLPTAFRLGAELILTKPVAKDQARNTIRMAVSKVRKDAPSHETAVAPSASGKPYYEPEWAAATSVSSQRTGFAGPPPSFIANALSASLAATLSAPSASSEMHSSVDEVDTQPVFNLNPEPESFSVSAASPELSATSELSSSADLTSSADLSVPRVDSVNAKLARLVKTSDDSVLGEAEKTHMQDAGMAEMNPAESKPKSSGLDKAAARRPATKSVRQLSSSYKQGRPNRVGPLVALLMLVCAAGGFYAAWLYQPGFRDIAQPQIDRLLNVAANVLPPASSPTSAKPSPRVAQVKATPPSPQSVTNLNQTQSTASTTIAAGPAAGSTTNSATGSVADSTTGSTSTMISAPGAAAQPAAATSIAVILPASKATAPAVSVPAKLEANKTNDIKIDENKKVVAAAPASDAPLPGEQSDVILSSKGAEKRLAHSVSPKSPVDVHSADAQGKIVLKTVVDENGKVDGVRLVEGNAILATAAMQAVRQWRYRPYVRDGKALPFQTVVIIDFQRP